MICNRCGIECIFTVDQRKHYKQLIAHLVCVNYQYVRGQGGAYGGQGDAYRIRAKFGSELNLTVWRCVLEPPILMSANYFNLGGGADHSS